ncbi:MAG: alpha/beta hydrolase [Verrucomicrobia bacterium]|nr:alpha/beta hydrolase [Verrucomicrobiota bacterium]
MQRLAVNEAELVFVDHGEGAPVVFVHGALGDYRTWNAQLKTFARHHRAIAYSRRYHHPAHCADDVTDYTADRHASDLAALICRLKLQPAHVIGHSYGGAVAAWLAARHPELVRTLVLAEPTLFSLLTPKPENRPLVQELISLTEQVLARWQIEGAEAALRHFINAVIAPWTFDELAAPVRAVMMDNINTLKPMLLGTSSTTAFKSEHARKIKAPTLLLEGELSTAVFRQTIRELQADLPSSELITLPDVSHGLHLENPRQFNQTVLEFLSRH